MFFSKNIFEYINIKKCIKAPARDGPLLFSEMNYCTSHGSLCEFLFLVCRKNTLNKNVTIIFSSKNLLLNHLF